jgi:predicted N-acetyltransferase YhbS
MSITIRSLSEADLDSADAILQSGFGSSGRFKAEVRRYLLMQPDGWLIATLDDQPVGTVGAVDYGAFAYIGLMAVRAEAQRRGIGLTLMQHLLQWLDARGCPVGLLDATEAGAPLYARLGFVEDGRTLLFVQAGRLQLTDPMERVSLLRPEDIAAVAEFDAPIFGAERARVFRAYLSELRGRAFVVRGTTGRIAGYLFAQRRKLGPWAAHSTEDAAALLGAALSLSYEDPPNVSMPASNLAGTDLLLRSGFQQQRSLRHMRRGELQRPGRTDLLYGLASFAIG